MGGKGKESPLTLLVYPKIKNPRRLLGRTPRSRPSSLFFRVATSPSFSPQPSNTSPSPLTLGSGVVELLVIRHRSFSSSHNGSPLSGSSLGYVFLDLYSTLFFRAIFILSALIHRLVDDDDGLIWFSIRFLSNRLRLSWLQSLAVGLGYAFAVWSCI